MHVWYVSRVPALGSDLVSSSHTKEESLIIDASLCTYSYQTHAFWHASLDHPQMEEENPISEWCFRFLQADIAWVGLSDLYFRSDGPTQKYSLEKEHIPLSPLFFKVCRLLLTLCELVSYNPHKVADLVSIMCMRPLLLASAGEDFGISYYISHYFPSTENQRLTRPYYAPLDTYGWHFKEQIKSLKSSFPMGRLSSFPCVNKVGRFGRSTRKSGVRVKSQFSSVFVYLSVCLSVCLLRTPGAPIEGMYITPAPPRGGKHRNENLSNGASISLTSGVRSKF